MQGVIWRYNIAMVYKLNSDRTYSKVKIFALLAATIGLRIFVLAAALLYFMGYFSTEIVLGYALGLALFGVVLCAAITLRALNRQKKLVGDIFVTLTERGMMLETPATENKSYITWQRVEKAVVVGGMMHVSLKKGLPLLLPVCGLKKERVEEMLRFCKENAGREIPADKQIPLPEEWRSESPISFLSTRAMRQVDADVLMGRMHPYVSWVALLCAPLLFSCGLIFVAVCLWDEWRMELWEPVFACVAFFYVFRFLYVFRHPGYKLKKWIQREEVIEMHFRRDHVLVVHQEGGWTSVSENQVEDALETRHSYMYLTRYGGLFSIPKEIPPLPSLPAPRKLSMRKRTVAMIVSLLTVPLLLCGVFMWGFQKGGYDEVDTEHILYVEELTPVIGFPGEMLEAEEYEDEEENVSWLRMVWEDGTYVFLTLPDATAPQGD